MWWRVTSSEFARQAGAGLEAQLKELVDDGRRPGLLGYEHGRPVGWVSIGDRSEFGRLNRSPKLKPVDDVPVASIVCFYVARDHRRQGIQHALLVAAIEDATEQGYAAVEGYPIDTAKADRAAADLFTGTLDLFRAAGFTEIARRQGRPIVRLTLPSHSRRPAD